MQWEREPNSDEKRHRYYASREWAMKRSEIRQRSGGTCERCKRHKAAHCHHLTYKRLYNEPLTDLQDLCEGCHQFAHGRTTVDPAAESEHVNEIQESQIVRNGLVRCPACQDEESNIHLVAVRVNQNLSGTLVTREGVDTVELAAHKRRGSEVLIQMTCEQCEGQFYWSLRFHKGVTFFNLTDVPRDQERDDQLWRD